MAATHKKSIFYNIVKYDNKVEGKVEGKNN